MSLHFTPSFGIRFLPSEFFEMYGVGLRGHFFTAKELGYRLAAADFAFVFRFQDVGNVKVEMGGGALVLAAEL